MKIFEVAGEGKLHGLTVMSLDSFVNGEEPEKEVEESTGKQKHRVAVTVSDPNHQAVTQRKETKQRMCTVTADGREQACDTAINWYKKQGYKVHDHNYHGLADKKGVAENTSDNPNSLHSELAAVYKQMAPGIEKYRDSFKAGQLYDALEAVAEKHGAHREFTRMMGSARNSAHMEYDTNPRGFENWFWFLPFAEEQGVAEAGPNAPYTPSPAKPFRNPPGFNKQGTGVGNKLAQLNRKEWEEKKKKEQGVAEGSLTEAPGDFGLGANYRAVPDDEMQAFLDRSKTKTKTKRDKFDYPYVHGSNIEVKDEGGKSYDSEALKKSIMIRPKSILGQNAKMQHSETGEEAIFDIGLPALKGLAVNEKTGQFVVVDTCPGAGACQTYCYAMKGSYVMFKAVSMGLARMLNFLLNDPEGFANQLNAEIAAAKAKYAKKGAKIVVRWHDAGDFFSPEYMDMAYGVANANPDVGFYAYTKMGDVANAARPKNFNMNFSQGAKRGQEKKVDIVRTKHSKVVPKDMFFDLIARKGNELIKDAKGRMQFASPENLEQFKTALAQKYAIDRDSILTYDQMMKTPVGDTPKWNVIVMPGDGDNSANRNDVVGSYLLFH